MRDEIIAALADLQTLLDTPLPVRRVHEELLSKALAVLSANLPACPSSADSAVPSSRSETSPLTAN